ncbi:hypothetical protein [Mangrovimonas sp. TPBH4]|uniref:hypothetical protein n=1 Tax=Mangrovimonas sp. TPBH4 TaxID=1645914 RepID=UPI000B0765E7|nr:hypothetical protein [Mangrovimonas sp. TPBH4]
MKIKKSLFVIVAVFFLFLLAACGSAHTNVGVDMRFGPNGPHVSPHVGVDFYGGGRH